MLRESGFEVEYLTEFMLCLFPLVWLGRRVHDRKRGIDPEKAVRQANKELTIVPVVNSILKLILSWESAAIRRRWRLPIGTSLLAIARNLQCTEQSA